MVAGMKRLISVVSALLVSLFPVSGEPASKSGGGKSAAAPEVPVYKEESPLPKGWPPPGPFHEVAMKTYPAYRAAFTRDSSTNRGFRRLFQHIQGGGIPMTAPVEMKLDPAADGGAEMLEMAFLYQSPAVGKAGAAGENVEVRDIPATRVLAYTWQGPGNDASVARARKLLDEALAQRNLKAAGYRLLGYNSPFVPRSRQTHELQAVLR